MEICHIIIRSFQPNVDNVTFNRVYFKYNVENRIRSILNTKVASKIIIIINGDNESKFGEKIDNQGLTPTYRAVYENFKKEIRDGVLECHICFNWGLNPGSATALNEGILIAERNNTNYVLCWSPELFLDKEKISKGLNIVSSRGLDVLGFLRERWWEKTQWNMVQNTGAIWKIESLRKVNYFDEICNGTGETIDIENYGKALLAGMEDFHALLKIYRTSSEFNWGMFGLSEPVKWKTDFGGNPEKEKRFEMKVARQFTVMREYVKRLFPQDDFYHIMNEIYKRYSVF
jgi:hypothetical protein